MKVRNPIPEAINTGKVLRKAIKEGRFTQSYLARKTNRATSTVSQLIRQRSTQSSILYEFSLAMNVNLFHRVAESCLPEELKKEPYAKYEEMLAKKDETIAELKKELEASKKQQEQLENSVKYLQTAMDMVSNSRKKEE